MARALMTRHHSGLSAAAALLVAALGCQRGPTAPPKPVVVATIQPLASLAEQIVGDAAEVRCLLPPGMSPHGYSPTANAMADLVHARLVVTNGLGIDHWAERAIEATGRSDLRVCTFAECVELAKDERGATAHGQAHSEAEAHGDHHHHGDVDPHLWMDPLLARAFAEALTGHLAAAIAEHAGAIRQRGAQLDDELAALDRELRTKLRPYRGGKIVTFHDAFGRLAERYGLEVAATLTPVNAPGDLTPLAIRQVVQIVRDHQLRAVYAEPQFSPAAARLLREKVGVDILILDPLGNPYEADRDTYAETMRYNVDQLIEGFGRP
jgi:ABC-type Zn uptake system ZnuABC Zn-binding protein ZnuA